LQVKSLTEEVTRLKNNGNLRIKNNVKHYLKKSSPPKLLFEEWINTFIVEIQHLEEVFQFNLTDGIKKIIKDRILLEGIQSIPLRAFKEKIGVIYIFTKEGNEEKNGSWEVCTNEKFGSMIDCISHEFTRRFCSFQIIDEETKFSYLTKITGSKINKDRQKSDLKSFTVSKIQIPLDL
jgi:hypothetical protein